MEFIEYNIGLSANMHGTGASQEKLDAIFDAMPVLQETTSGLTSALQLVDSTDTTKIVSDTTDASYLSNSSRG